MTRSIIRAGQRVNKMPLYHLSHWIFFFNEEVDEDAVLELCVKWAVPDRIVKSLRVSPSRRSLDVYCDGDLKKIFDTLPGLKSSCALNPQRREYKEKYPGPLKWKD